MVGKLYPPKEQIPADSMTDDQKQELLNQTERRRAEAIALLDQIVKDLNEAAAPVKFKREALGVVVDWQKIDDAHKTPAGKLDWAAVEKERRGKFPLKDDSGQVTADQSARTGDWIRRVVDALEDPEIDIVFRFTSTTAEPTKYMGRNMLGPSPAWIGESEDRNMVINIYWNSLGAMNVQNAIRMAGEGRSETKFGPMGDPIKNPVTGQVVTEPIGETLRKMNSPAGGFVNDLVKHHYILQVSPCVGFEKGKDDLFKEWMREMLSKQAPKEPQALVQDWDNYLSHDALENVGDSWNRDYRARSSPELYPKAYFLWKRRFDLWIQKDARRRGEGGESWGIGRPEERALMADLGYRLRKEDGDGVRYEEDKGPKGPDWPGRIFLKMQHIGGVGRDEIKIRFEADSTAKIEEGGFLPSKRLRVEKR